jgi:hypothetical protein
MCFNLGHHRDHNRVTVVLRETEDIRLSIEDRQVTAQLLLDFSQSFNMVRQATEYPELINLCRCARGVISRWTSKVC